MQTTTITLLLTTLAALTAAQSSDLSTHQHSGDPVTFSTSVSDVATSIPTGITADGPSASATLASASASATASGTDVSATDLSTHHHSGDPVSTSVSAGASAATTGVTVVTTQSGTVSGGSSYYQIDTTFTVSGGKTQSGDPRSQNNVATSTPSGASPTSNAAAMPTLGSWAAVAVAGGVAAAMV